MKTRLLQVLLLLVPLLRPSPAEGQKLDRGIDISSQSCFIRKGTWMIGGGARYNLHNNDRARFLVVSGVNSSGYTLSVSPAFCYMFKDNFGAGVRIGYKRNMFQLDSASFSFGDTDLGLSDYHKINHSFEIQGIGRYYIPVGSSRRLGLVNELQLAYSCGQGKVMDGHGESVVATYETTGSLGINFCPGFMAFVTDKLAIDVSVNMLGLQYDWADQSHNRVTSGNRSTSFINFRVNLLAVGFSLYYYL